MPYISLCKTCRAVMRIQLETSNCEHEMHQSLINNELMTLTDCRNRKEIGETNCSELRIHSSLFQGHRLVNVQWLLSCMIFLDKPHKVPLPGTSWKNIYKLYDQCSVYEYSFTMHYRIIYILLPENVIALGSVHFTTLIVVIQANANWCWSSNRFKNIEM